ncbi:MAG: hypothetical protein KA198_02095 [Chitinophagaceae bacterium]|nr:hypothetical protein [Chitinophagaceae bacterium]
MIKKILLLSVCVFFALLMFGKKKYPKRTKQKIEHLTVQSSYYSWRSRGIGPIGNVYEFNITTLFDQIILDSVWFGNTPVPCDVFNMSTTYRVDTAIKKGSYQIKANKNLYRYFNHMIDSSERAKSFVEPFPFQGEAVICYKYKGKRYYKIIYTAENRPDKQMRQ